MKQPNLSNCRQFSTFNLKTQKARVDGNREFGCRACHFDGQLFLDNYCGNLGDTEERLRLIVLFSLEYYFVLISNINVRLERVIQYEDFILLIIVFDSFMVRDLYLRTNAVEIGIYFMQKLSYFMIE